MIKIYTKTGDKGTTSLHDGHRVSKDSNRINAVGNVDELNTIIGLVISKLRDNKDKCIVDITDFLTEIQKELFVCGSDLATPPNKLKSLKQVKLTSDKVDKLEKKIDSLERELEPLNKFILPGGSEVGALLHLSRAVCRRAERSVVTVMLKEEINPICQVYLNRLSDLFFVLARIVNKINKVSEYRWLV